MEPVRQTQKKYGSRAMVVAIVIAMALILAGFKPSAKGLVLGSLFSVLNFVLMGEILPLRMGRSRRGAFMISLASIGFRYALMAVPLVVAVKSPMFNVFAVIPGLLMVQLVVLADHFSAAWPFGQTKRLGGRV